MGDSDFVCACAACADDEALEWQHNRWINVMSILNERQMRLYAAQLALDLGRGGITRVGEVTGLSALTIRRGIRELEQGATEPYEFVRKAGGGRHALERDDPRILAVLESLMGETTAGDPMGLLKWTTKSTRSIAAELTRRGHPASHSSVLRLLRELDYSLRGNVKSLEGKQHPDRDAQFRYVHATVKERLRAKTPVISVDTKKKENVGLFKSNGRRWRRNDSRVNAYDFPSLGSGPAHPYGIYDEIHNEGLVNVGMSRDTAEFAAESIDRWWRMMGRPRYPGAKELLITADGGGSNSSRARLWKYSIQQFANRHGLNVTVCHFPPGTSKWNKIEHRMFSHISISWRGEPLTTYETVIEFIQRTTTKTGLKIKAILDEHKYQKGKKPTAKEMEEVNLKPHKKHPNWNYTIERR